MMDLFYFAVPLWPAGGSSCTLYLFWLQGRFGLWFVLLLAQRKRAAQRCSTDNLSGIYKPVFKTKIFGFFKMSGNVEMQLYAL